MIRDRIVVDHDRQRTAAGDRTEVGHRLAGIGFVDHGRQHHQAVQPDLLGIGREPAGLGRGAFGHTGEDRHAAGHVLDGGFQDFELLLIFQRAVLADGAEHDDAVDARLEHGFQVFASGRQIETQIGQEVGRRRGVHAVPINRHGKLLGVGSAVRTVV